MLRFMGSQRVRHNWANELNWTCPTRAPKPMGGQIPTQQPWHFMDSWKGCSQVYKSGSRHGEDWWPLPGVRGQSRCLIRDTCVCAQLLSRLWLFCNPMDHQAPPSMGSPRQEYWSELPFPTSWDLSNPGVKPTSLASPALAGRFFTTEPTWEGMSPILTSQEGRRNRLIRRPQGTWRGWLVWPNSRAVWLSSYNRLGIV